MVKLDHVKQESNSAQSEFPFIMSLRIENLSQSSPISLWIYNGVKSREAFGNFDSRLIDLFYSNLWSVLRWFSLGVGFAVNQIFLLTNNWIFTIVLMAILIKLVNHPASAWGLRTQEKTKANMNKIKPQLDQIGKNYKGLEKNEKIMEVYKEHGISPFAGMSAIVPILLQIPFFIALYAILSEEYRLSDANF